MRSVKQFLLKKATPCLCAVILLVSPLSLCVRAAVWEGSVTLRVDYWGAGNGIHYKISEGVYPTPISSSTPLQGPKANQIVNGLYFCETATTWTSDVDVYMGGYYRTASVDDTISMVGDPYNSGNYEVTYRGAEGQSGDVLSSSLIELSAFTPNETMPHGEGISVRASWAASEALPISELQIRPVIESGWQKTTGGSYTQAGYWVITSVRVVSAETSAELDELSNVADQIIAGNQILEAMKGDVVGLLQQIYATVGDIEIAANKTKDLLATLLTYVDGIEDQLDDIYTLLGSFFSQMITLMRGNNDLLDAILVNSDEIIDLLGDIAFNLFEGSGDAIDETQQQVQEGSAVQDGLNELQKPDYEDFAFNTEDYVDQFDGGSGESQAAFSGFMDAIFGSSMITTMMIVTLSFAMVAYVLYGKR